MRTHFKPDVNDDDGVYTKAGFRTTVMDSGGSRDTEHHLPGDVLERVNLENLVRGAQLLLAAVLEIAENGAALLQNG